MISLKVDEFTSSESDVIGGRVKLDFNKVNLTFVLFFVGIRVMWMRFWQ